MFSQLFEKCGKVADVTIARKKDPKKPESFLSMGYGFVEFKKKESADEAIKTLQVPFSSVSHEFLIPEIFKVLFERKNISLGVALENQVEHMSYS